jgi:hypothetical protein
MANHRQTMVHQPLLFSLGHHSPQLDPEKPEM